MKRLFAAIASALRSTVSMIWEKCQKTGAWTMRAVASIGGGGSAPAIDTSLQELEQTMARDPDALIAKAQAASAATLTPPATGGDGYDRIQRTCRNINCGEQPARDDWEALSPVQRDWLQELTPSMRLLVGNIEREALVQHMRGSKGLKGVLRCDAESVAAWKHASAIEATIAELGGVDPELAPAPRIAI